MQIENSAVFVSGANRGIGKALVEALLKHKVKKVYAAARKLEQLPNFNDARVVPVLLDITNPSQVKSAAEKAADTQILINNAGALEFASVLTGEMDKIKRDMEVNYFGTLSLTRSFIPVLEPNGKGAIATISSIVGLASMSSIGGYSASKAALFSAIQAMRSELKAKNIEVFGIYPGPIDTDMARPMDMPKTSAAVTAENILSSIASGKEDIFPDAMSAQLGAVWARDPKALERQFATM